MFLTYSPRYIRPESTLGGSSTGAGNERSVASTATTSNEMDVDLVYTETNKQYISLHEVGKGTCGKVTFCIPTTFSTSSHPATNPTARSSALVAIKIPSQEMCRGRIADEITALRHVGSFFAAGENANLAKHFPTLIDFEPVVSGKSRWLVVSPIRGFDLERLRVVITNIGQPSSGHFDTHCLPFPVIPEALVLNIAKQLTEAVGWLHDMANIAHNDIFGGNVMLDVSAWNKGSGFTMPKVVMIDFDRARLGPSEKEKGVDRSFVYELIHMLDSTGRAMSQGVDTLEEAIVPEDLTTWWNALMSFLVINKGQHLQEMTSSFARFRERFGAEIDRRLGSVTKEEETQVQELLDLVVEKEVRFPSEERIEEVLRQWEDD